MKQKIILFSIIVLCLFLLFHFVNAAQDLSQKLSGKILLQVKNNGEAWYVNPFDLKRYYLGRPQDAFDIMRALGKGITNSDLEKIPFGDLVNKNSQKYTSDFAARQSGKILLQVQENGEAWYINPADLKRYYLGRPEDAFNIMRKLGLGITNVNIEKIPIGEIKLEKNKNQIPANIPMTNNNSNIDLTSSKNTLNGAAYAILDNDFSKVKKYFVEGMSDRLKYSMDYWSATQRYEVANLMLGAKFLYSDENMDFYINQMYFTLGKSIVPIKYTVEKQPNGEWLLTNL